MEKINADNVLQQNELDALNNDTQRVQSMLSVIIKGQMTVKDIEELNNNFPESVKKKREIVRTHIKEVRLTDWKYMNVDFPKSDLTVEIKRKRYLEIEVHDKYGYVRKWLYFPRWSFGQSKIQEIT